MNRKPFFSNPWWVVFGSTIGLVVSNGPITLFTFGLFLKPISRDFGWSRGEVSLAIVFCQLAVAVATPVVGTMMDRWGIRAVTLPMIALFALATAAISQTPGSPVAFILFYSFWGLTASAQGPPPYAKAISAWFEEKRGLALGIAIGGVGVGATILPQLVRVMINRFGWRGAYVGLGIVTFAFAFPAFALFVREPPDALAKRRESRNTAGRESASASVSGMSVGEVMKSYKFWFMAIAAFLVAASVNGTTAHIPALLTDRGISNEFAATVLTVAGLAMIAGRVFSGYLLDIFFAPYVAAVFFLLPLFGLLLLRTGLAGAVPFLGAICLGLGLGAEVALLAFLVGRYFGLRTFAQVYGYLFALVVFASGLGPYLMGVCFDVMHSYNPALVGFSLCIIVASALVSRLGPYVYPARAISPAEPSSTAVEAR